MVEIKGVVFDIDGTLIDFIGMKRLAANHAAMAMMDAGLNMSLPDASRELFKTYMEVGIDSEIWLGEFLKRYYGKADESMIIAGKIAYQKARETFMEPYPRVIPTLLQLIKRGIKLAVLTDASKLKALKRLHTMKLYHFFDVIVTIEDSGCAKPHQDTFRKVLDGLKLEAEEVLMVGDVPERDIEGAKQVGMRTVFAKYGALDAKKILMSDGIIVSKEGLNADRRVEGSNADYEINEVSEILKIVDLVKAEKRV